MAKELVTLEIVVFWTAETNFRKVQDNLKQLGFVNALGWDRYRDTPLFDDCLVYEEEGVGVFRCSFHRRNVSMHRVDPCLDFKYWEGRMTADQRARDPMRQVVREVYQLLKPVLVTNWDREKVIIE